MKPTGENPVSTDINVLHKMQNTLAAMGVWIELLGRRDTSAAERARALEALAASVQMQSDLLEVARGGAPRRVKAFSPSPSPGPVIAGLRVLLLDDDGDFRDGLAALLARLGAQVSAVATTGAALAQLNHDWDVIISDWRLGDERGGDFLRDVRRLPSDRGGAVPAIALTAAGRPEDRAASQRAGFQIHLVKPPLLEELLSAIVRVTSRQD